MKRNSANDKHKGVNVTALGPTEEDAKEANGRKYGKSGVGKEWNYEARPIDRHPGQSRSKREVGPDEEGDTYRCKQAEYNGGAECKLL